MMSRVSYCVGSLTQSSFHCRRLGQRSFVCRSFATLTSDKVAAARKAAEEHDKTIQSTDFQDSLRILSDAVNVNEVPSTSPFSRERLPTDRKTHIRSHMEEIPGRMTAGQLIECFERFHQSPGEWPLDRLAAFYKVDSALLASALEHTAVPVIHQEAESSYGEWPRASR